MTIATTRKTPVPNRIISLAEVTQQSANDVIKFIYEVNNEDKSLKQRTPIKLLINSEGDRSQEIYDSLLISFTNLNHNQLNMHKDTSSYWYINAEDALRFNIVDEIL